jgi:hypothetical protein
MLALLASLLMLAGAAQRDAPVLDGARPIIDNEQVVVWDLVWTNGTPAVMDRQPRNAVWVYLSPTPGQVAFWRAGEERTLPAWPGRAIAIELKSSRGVLPNKSGHPIAFPREGSVKKIENASVVVWDHTWTPGKPSPVHFHDKDVVVVYLKNGTLKSTTADGQSTTTELTPGLTRFNLRDRVHTETLVEGESRAIITELK